MAVCRRSWEKYVWIALNTASSAGNRTTIPTAGFSSSFWNCRLSHLVSYLSYVFQEITLQRRKNSWWHESSAFCGNEMKATLREQSLLQPYGVAREFHHILDVNMTFVRVAFMLTCLVAWSGSHLGKKRVHSLRADSHHATRFRSVTVPSSFHQNGMCSYCPSCLVTSQNSTW